MTAANSPPRDNKNDKSPALATPASKPSEEPTRQSRPSLIDEVQDASEDSFPASDPPPWSPTTTGKPSR